MKRILKLLSENMSPQGYRATIALLKYIPLNVWIRPASSGGKYHQDDNGRVRTIGEHTYEMLVQAIIDMTDRPTTKRKSRAWESILLGILFHDTFKYGREHKDEHTDPLHACYAYCYLYRNRNITIPWLGAKVTLQAEMIVRLHEGDFAPQYGPAEWGGKRDRTRQRKKEKRFPAIKYVQELDRKSCFNKIKLPEEYKR